MDRHLFGLKIAALVNNLPVPALFSSPAFARLHSFDLSTSQVPMSIRPHMIYAPLVEDGYAALYNPCEEVIDIGFSVFTTSTVSDLDAFARSVFASLRDMRDVLVEAGRVDRAKF